MTEAEIDQFEVTTPEPLEEGEREAEGDSERGEVEEAPVPAPTTEQKRAAALAMTEAGAPIAIEEVERLLDGTARTGFTAAGLVALGVGAALGLLDKHQLPELRPAPEPTDALAPDLLARLREATRETGFSDSSLLTFGIDYARNLGTPQPWHLQEALGQELAELAQRVPESIEEIVRMGMDFVRLIIVHPEETVSSLDETIRVAEQLRAVAERQRRIERSDSAPAAPKLPQAGEVWARTEDDELHKIVEVDPGLGHVSFEVIHGDGALRTSRIARFLTGFYFVEAPAPLPDSIPLLRDLVKDFTASADGLRASIKAAGAGEVEEIAGADAEWEAVEFRRLVERIEVKALELAVEVRSSDKIMADVVTIARATSFADHLRARILGGGA